MASRSPRSASALECQTERSIGAWTASNRYLSPCTSGSSIASAASTMSTTIPLSGSAFSVEEFVANAVRTEADVFHRHAGALRILALSTATDAAASERGTRAVRDTEHRFRDHVELRLQADGCSDPARIATTVFRVVFGALISRITWPDQQGDPPIPWQRFVDDLCHMTSAYAADRCHSTRDAASSTRQRQRRGRPRT